MNVELSTSFVFWNRCIYRIVKYNKDIKALEEAEGRLKEE
jgi:hypothetical protein